MLVGVGSLTFFLMVSPGLAHDPEFAPGGTSLQTATVIEGQSNGAVACAC